MSERPQGYEGEDEQTADLAPENHNSEQDDGADQAQSVADDAFAADGDAFEGVSNTEKVKGGIADEDDQQDLVDHMNQMVTSGRIDMSAFRGEPNLDDEEGTFGPAADEEDYETDE